MKIMRKNKLKLDLKKHNLCSGAFDLNSLRITYISDAHLQEKTNTTNSAWIE